VGAALCRDILRRRGVKPLPQYIPANQIGRHRAAFFLAFGEGS
jgi:hypothetical protein